MSLILLFHVDAVIWQIKQIEVELQNNCEEDLLFFHSLLLSARVLIYGCKYSGTKPNMLHYFYLPNNVKSTEYLRAKHNNTLFYKN